MPGALKREDEIDKRYDDELNRRGLQQAEQSAGEQANYDREFADIADNYDKTAPEGQENANVEKARQQENQFSYSKDNQPSKDGSRAKGWLKKFGPSGGILGLIFGGIFGFGVLFSPALAVVHLKEVFTEDLNDSLSAMDVRSIYVMRAKVKDMGRGVCTGVKIRCGLRGMTDRQIRAFEKAGIEVETDGKNQVTRKNRVTRMVFTTTSGEKIPIRNINELNRRLGDQNIRNQLRRAYNPLFYSTWDKTFGKVLTKWKTSRADKLTGNTPDEMDESLESSTAGEDSTLDTEAEAENCADDDDACKQRNEEREQRAQEGEEKARGGGGGARKVFGGALKGVGVLGAVDAACTVYNTSLAVEAGAKLIRARQLAQYAMVFLTFADQVKAGDATPEQAEYVGNKLTAIDTDEFIINETSGGTVNAETGKIQNAKEVKNPSYGKNAFDSEGARAAFYNDAPTLNSRSAQFTVGGGLVGTLASVNSTITERLGGNPRSKCELVQNPFVRGGSLAVGIVAAFFSGGTSLVAGVGASLLVSAALPLLETYLKDMLAGETIGKNTKGVDAGNAIFSGTATMLGSGAQARGMKPADKSELQTYLAKTEQVQQEYIAMGIEDAKDTPFDIMNQYSFAGMFARKLLPAYTTGSSMSATVLQGLPNLFSTTLSDALPTSKAVGDFNPDRFSKCEDSGYKSLGIDADIFCNVRYVMSPKELGMDTEEVYVYMVETGQIDDDHNVQDGSDYEEFLENCVNREAGWGSALEENASLGEECMEENSKMSNFRVYTMDRSIEEGMDNGPQQQGQGENSDGLAPTTGASFRIASFNILHVGDKSHEQKWRERLPKSINALTSNNVDIAGLQEVRPDQYDLFVSQNRAGAYGTKFGIYPKTSKKPQFSPNPVIWNTDKYELVKGEKRAIEYDNGKKINHFVMVRLRSIETEQEFYVASTHDPANVRPGSDATNKQSRKDNARMYAGLYKQLNAPLFLTGDFNSSSDGYCILTASNGGAWNAYDASRKPPKTGQCPSKGEVGIDHIYLPKNGSITASNFNKLEREYNGGGGKEGGNNGSDHPTIITDIAIPSGEDGLNLPSKDGWVWPVPGVKQMGILGYGESGSKGVHKGIDIGISGGGALGKTVVAAHDGTVVYRGGESDACGAYVVIKATGTKYYAAYQHVANIKVSKNDPVTAGTPIAEIGRQGGSTCGSSGFYHLHFSVETIFSPSHPVSTYADRHPHGTINPLSVLPR